MKVLAYIEIDVDFEINTKEDAELMVKQVVQDGAVCCGVYSEVTILDVLSYSPHAE